MDRENINASFWPAEKQLEALANMEVFGLELETSKDCFFDHATLVIHLMR